MKAMMKGLLKSKDGKIYNKTDFTNS